VPREEYIPGAVTEVDPVWADALDLAIAEQTISLLVYPTCNSAASVTLEPRRRAQRSREQW